VEIMVKQELVHVLKHMTKKEKMKHFLLNLTGDSREDFFNVLSFLTEQEQERWIDVYGEL